MKDSEFRTWLLRATSHITGRKTWCDLLASFAIGLSGIGSLCCLVYVVGPRVPRDERTAIYGAAIGLMFFFHVGATTVAASTIVAWYTQYIGRRIRERRRVKTLNGR